MREFLFVDDMAEASLFVLELEKNTYLEHTEAMLYNIGSGKDITIKELAETMKEVVSFKGKISFISQNLMNQKLTDTKCISSIGWTFKTNLKEGLEKTYEWYLKNYLNYD